MKHILNKNIKLFLIIILLTIFIFPFLKEIKFEHFLNHPIERTDLDWQLNSVNCIKSSLPEVEVVGFFASSIPVDSIVMTEYQLQNLFVPIVLDIYEPWKYEFTVVYESDSEMLLSDEFNVRQIIVKCDDLMLLAQEPGK